MSGRVIASIANGAQSVMSRSSGRSRIRNAAVSAALLLSLGGVAAQAANTVTQTVSAGTQSATVADLTLAPVAYSTQDQASDGTLTLTVDDSSGTSAGWSVTIQSSDFVYSGANGGADIPAADFAITSAAAPVVTSGQAVDATNGPRVPASGATGALDTPRTVLQAAAGYGAGAYSQTLAVELTVPGMSRAGTYTGSLLVTVGAAP